MTGLFESVIFLSDDVATTSLGGLLAGHLKPGNCLALHGDLGAGKTALARSVIQALQDDPEDVPSPTFALVQDYDSRIGPIFHFDLYRVSGPDDLIELGFDDALADGLTLIEWPDRAGAALPTDALIIDFKVTDNGGRLLQLKGHQSWVAGFAGEFRAQAKAAFLQDAGWGDAEIKSLAGDASFRTYDRLNRDGEPAVLMDAPPEKDEDCRPFVAVNDWYQAQGFNTAPLLAHDIRQGFLLLGDLGDDLFARVLEGEPGKEQALYEAAIDLLIQQHEMGPPDRALPLPDGDHYQLQDYDLTELMREVRLLIGWTWPLLFGEVIPEDIAWDYDRRWERVLEPLEPGHDGIPPVLVHRDYHAENLFWLPDGEGVQRVGLIDHQDALYGHAAYDLVSLLEDARRDVDPAFAEAMLNRYLNGRPDVDPAKLCQAFALLAAQRNVKIVGIFCRLYARDGKAKYLGLLDRVWGLVNRDLDRPGLEDVKAWFDQHIPRTLRTNIEPS